MLPIALDEGLVLRSVRPADTEALVAFKADIHRMPGAPEPDPYVAAWARDLLERPHPTFRPEWFLVVEDTATGEIVSSLNVIPQTWLYGGIPLPVGRIEMVGTKAEYRRRGLVRRQMDIAHHWGEEQGHLAQVIMGIPWYYRQFGYEYAVDSVGSRSVDLDQIPVLPDGEYEPFHLRPATVEDLPFIASAADRGASRYAVTCRRDAAQWRYELDGRTIPERFFIVERVGAATARAGLVGFVAVTSIPDFASFRVSAYELTADALWLDVTPSLLRGLRRLGEERVAREATSLVRIVFGLGEDHPVYRTHSDLRHVDSPPYAWYVRVADVPAFIRRIAPVLEDRLARSELAGFSGELRLQFFRDGLRLVYRAGRLADIALWRDRADSDADALFPPLTFLQSLFGRRSLTELEAAFPDCQVLNQRTRLLLDVLFPRQPSLIWPVM